MKLKPPLSFQGGKQRIADKIIEIITDVDGYSYELIDMCCGSGAVSLAAINSGVKKENITMVDKSEWGSFWEQISTNTFNLELFYEFIGDVPHDPEDIQDYLKFKTTDDFSVWSDNEIIPLWLLLQAGSFGGKHIWMGQDNKWKNASFRNYWKPTETSSRRSPVNPMMPMPDTLKNNVTNLLGSMEGVTAFKSDVTDFDFNNYEDNKRKSNRVVIFLDPPYKNTTGYGCNFDYEGWYERLNLPYNYELWITEYIPLSDEFYVLNKTNKGGISGNKSKKNTEILSRIF